MASIKGFLTNYFKQLHFNAMTPEVRNRWNEYLKRGDLTSKMKDWRNQLMEKTTEDGEDKYTEFDLPNIEKGQNSNREGEGKPGDPGLTDVQIIELYKYMNEAVSAMAEDKKLKNTEFATAKAFINDFYGENNVFNIIPLEESTCDKLKNLFTDTQNAKLLEVVISNNLPDGLTYNEFIDGIKQKKYNVDAGFRDKLQTVIDKLQYANYQLRLNREQEELIEQIIALKDELNPEPSKHSIERFKNNYDAVLQRLYNKSKAKELFAAHDNHGIISALDTARDEVDYDKTDSDNYIYPKVEKQLNPAQRIKKGWDDFKENRLDKWKNFAGDYMFQSRAAEDIVKQIKKEGIKPTDGLAAILDKAKTIESNMPHTSPQTVKHFKWFIDEITKIKGEDDKAFEACLYNGISLRGVVERLIKDAVKADKIAEAKTALEILSVIKYENTTSKTLDAIKEDKELFTLLSNKDLSWNKNEGVKFVTGALDKTIRVGGIAIATMATVAVNSIRKLGSKIKKENKTLAAAHGAQTEKWGKDQAALDKRITASEQNKQNKQSELDAFVAANGDEDAINANLKSKQDSFDSQSAIMEDFKKNKELNDNFQALKNFLESEDASEEDLAAVREFAEKFSEYLDGESTTKPLITGISESCPVYNNVKNLHDLLESFDKAQSELTDAQKKKQDFVNATNALRNAEDEHRRNTEEMKNWDKNHMDRYDELVNYWNNLEFGRDLHLGRLFGGHYSHWGKKKTKQENIYSMFNMGMTRKDEYQAAA